MPAHFVKLCVLVHISNDVHKINRNVGTGTEPTCTAHLSALHLGKLASISLVKTLHHSTTSFLLNKLVFRFRTCQAKLSTSDGSDCTNYIDCFSYPTRRECFGNFKQGFALSIVHVQVFSASVLAYYSFETTSVIHLMGFFSDRGVMFLPELPGFWQNNSPIAETLKILFIAFVRQADWLVLSRALRRLFDQEPHTMFP